MLFFYQKLRPPSKTGAPPIYISYSEAQDRGGRGASELLGCFSQHFFARGGESAGSFSPPPRKWPAPPLKYMCVIISSCRKLFDPLQKWGHTPKSTGAGGGCWLFCSGGRVLLTFCQKRRKKGPVFASIGSTAPCTPRSAHFASDIYYQLR